MNLAIQTPVRRLLTVITFVGLLLGAGIQKSAVAADSKPSFFPAALQVEGNNRVFSIGDDSTIMFSSLGKWPNQVCSSFEDPLCDFTVTGRDKDGEALLATASLGVCDKSKNEDCVESIEISRDGISYSKLEFEGNIPRSIGADLDGKEFPANYAKFLPRGEMPTIWREVQDGKVSELKYLVSYAYNMYFNAEKKIFQISDISLAIRPFKEVPGRVWASLWDTEVKSGIPYEFETGTSFRAVVHISNLAAGWFKARLKDPNIEIEPLTSRNNRLTISGTSVEVPNFAIVRSIATLNEREAAMAENFGYSKGVVNAASGINEIFDYVDYFRPILDDTAPRTNSYWSINSTQWNNQNRCLRDSSRVLGVVSTNAMGYDGTSPKFESGFLNYRVTGLHFAADGVTPNLGTYDLLLRSDAARCLYGFTKAPISASVSIVGGAGSQNVATTVVSEKDGWLKLKAYGFTFSEKKIKVAFTQKSKKRSITCVKGTVSKKLTGTSPKCPAGFKVKR